MKWALLALALPAAGCAQIFGLDETHVAGDDAPPVDASVDGPLSDLPPCDQPLACSGRLCGLAVDFANGTTIASPSMEPEACLDGAVEPPCSFAVSLHDYASIEANVPVATGTIDTCGRFEFPEVDTPAEGWVAIIEDAAGLYQRSAAVVTNAQYPFALGTQYSMMVISNDSASQAPGGAWVAVAADQELNPLAGMQFTLDGTNPLTPPSVIYFADPEPTTHITPDFSADATGPNGSGVLLNPSGNLQILGCNPVDPLELRDIADLYIQRGITCF